MKISVIIPNFNGKELLEKNLPKIISTAKNCEIIVVDDASTDDSVYFITKNFPQIKLIARKVNHGFASSVNDGVKASTGELILLLNTDVIPTQDFINPLVLHFQNSKIFAVGCLQKSSNWSGKTVQGRGIGKFEEGFLVHAPGDIHKNNTLWVFGGAAIYKKSIWQKLGGLETLYDPFYWEDIDISYRALKRGYQLIFEPESIVYHEQGSGAIRTYHQPPFINSIAYRNQILFVWLNITDFQLLLEHVLYLPWHLIKSIINNDKAFISGLLQAIQRFPEVLKKRFHHLKTFCLSDSDVLAVFKKEF